jgi:hypothetical protein
MRPDDHTTPADLRARVGLLALEREAAEGSSLGDDSAYMVDLRDEIAAVEAAYVGAAVIEIASLRADLDGRLVG